MKNKIKILFVKPESPNGHRIVDIPLGVLSLSAYLKEKFHDRIDVKLIDMRLHGRGKGFFIRYLKHYRPDIIGFSVLNCDNTFLVKYSALSSFHLPESLIIAGGPYATADYDSILNETKVKYTVIGEGEIILFNIIKKMINNEEIEEVRGIAYLHNSKVVSTDREEYIPDINSLPMPDYSIINFNDYFGLHEQMNIILSKKKYAPVLSSRACPYNCLYCHNIFGKHFKGLSPDNFWKNVKYLHDFHGIKEFHIIDDIFNLERERMHIILNTIINSGIKISIAFPNGLRGDILTEEDIELLKKAGTYMITFAVETASARIQKLINKNLNLDKLMNNIRYAREKGIITRGFFMIGFPGEQPAEIIATINFAVNSYLHLANFFIVRAFKGTGLEKLAANEYHGMKQYEHANYLSGKSLYTESTGIDLNKMQFYAYIKFYDIMRVLKIVRLTPRKLYFFYRFFSQFIFLLKLKITSALISARRKKNHN